MSLNQNYIQLPTEESAAAHPRTGRPPIKGVLARLRVIKLQWKSYKEERRVRKQRARGSRPSKSIWDEIKEGDYDTVSAFVYIG